jgi:hypothetical protein
MVTFLSSSLRAIAPGDREDGKGRGFVRDLCRNFEPRRFEPFNRLRHRGKHCPAESLDYSPKAHGCLVAFAQGGSDEAMPVRVRVPMARWGEVEASEKSPFQGS